MHTAILDMLVFGSLVLGLGLFVDRWLKELDVLERLCAIVGTSFVLTGFGAFAFSLLGTPRYLHLLLPLLGLAQLIWHGQKASLPYFDSELRRPLLAWLTLTLWCLGFLALVVTYSGGGWAFDWLEHFKRSLFFLQQQPADTLLPGGYAIPARPPLANWFVSACLGIVGPHFDHFQVFSCLAASLAILPLLLLVKRFSGALKPSTLWLATLLCLLSPFVVQNATFAWTKLPAAFFVLCGYALLAPNTPLQGAALRRRLGWLSLAAGLLCHYSAAPWIVGAILAHAYVRRAELRQPAFWREQALSAALCLVLLLPWFTWSLAHYGPATWSSTSSTVGAKAGSAAGQLSVILGNIWNTLVPHFLRSFDTSLLLQKSSLGLLRDQWFSLYQINLFFLFGATGWLVLLFALFRRWPSGPSASRSFWIISLPIAAVLGIVVHSIPDSWGLAHICLQPLGLLGLACLAASWDALPRRLRSIALAGLAVDLLMGLVLHFGIQSFAIDEMTGSAASLQQHAAALSIGGQANFNAKLQQGLEFWGDSFVQNRVPVFALLLSLLLAVVNAALCRSGSSAPEMGHTRSEAWDLETWIRKPVAAWLLLGAIVLLMATAAKWMLWSTFMMYDDEGYVLYSLKLFSEQGRLYDALYSQYGPFYFLLNQGLHLLGMPFTNEAARVMNWIYWLGTCGFCASAVWRLSKRDLASTLFAFTFLIPFLYFMVNEPSHPGSWISFAVAFAAWLGCRKQSSPELVALAIGIVGAMLALTKINIGVFFLAGAGAWLVLHSHFGARRPVLRHGVFLLLVAMPWFLMRPVLDQAWVLSFAALVSTGLCSVWIVSQPSRDPLHAHRSFLWLAGGFAVVLIGTLVFLRSSGTSWQGMLDGILLSPLRMPAVFTSPIKWRAMALPLALLSLLLAVLSTRLTPERRFRLLLSLRLLCLAFFLLSWTGFPGLNIHAFVISYGLSFAWIFVPSLNGTDSTARSRSWLALLLLTQCLHAFPVAGSQIAFGSFLWFPLAALGIADALASMRSPTRQGLPFLARALALFLVVLCLLVSARQALLCHERVTSGERLGLPGAESLILPETYTSQTRILVDNARVHSDLLFSMPGMFSFNLWSGLPSPTLANATHWFTLLTPRQQEEIRQRLEASPLACVILERSIYNYLRVERLIDTESALTRWIHANFSRSFRIGSFEFWVRKGREIEPVGMARVRETDDRSFSRYRIELSLAPRQPLRIARVELHRIANDGTQLVHFWEGEAMQVILRPSSIGGAKDFAPYKTSLPFVLNQTARLYLFTPRFPAYFPIEEGILRFFDEEGRRVAEARFEE